MSFSIDVFIVIFARIFGMILLLPALGGRSVPGVVKVSIAFFVSVISYSLLQIKVVNFPVTLVCEFFIGIFLGTIFMVCFESISVISSIISSCAGLSNAYLFSYGLSEQMNVLYNCLFLGSILGIFDSNLHFSFLKVFLDSYNSLAVGAVVNLGQYSEVLLKCLSNSFIVAFKISSSFLVANILMMSFSGIVARLIPTFHVFLILTPAQTCVMFLILSVSFRNIFSQIVSFIRDINFV
ncbi:flagellar biosynthetic protein FliR [Candidatus Sneabacter namystus]|uniref:Flagellar biosynthetic protein FliR n=1 Tax=Candidatus Sneabacter namystus TaxID=2601646 RepID=A0A5C0UII7_9RICK|nr:flagellar biosynthetic protein FliR [Candidatus Sneabacter namystus]QEK39597.1 flagellar biosynthetic protein FliR [Candidatus Sneabacter namystus]